MRPVVKQLLIAMLGVTLCAAAGARASIQSSWDSGGGPSAGGLATQKVDAYTDVGVDEHRGAQVPLDVPFTDETGKPVTLREMLVAGKPIVLQLGYFGCPNLCDLVSKGMVESLGKLKFTAGQDYSIVYISFDPSETWRDGQLKKDGFLKKYDRPVSPAGWHFLVGPQTSVRAVSDAVGFKYKWVESAKQFSHAAAIMVLTPDGKVSQYLYGITFPEQPLRLSLVQASDRQIGSATDRILLYCFHYDATTGKYTLAAVNLMRVAAGLTVLALGLFLVPRFVRDARAARTRREAAAGVAADHGADETTTTTTTTTTKENPGDRR